MSVGAEPPEEKRPKITGWHRDMRPTHALRRIRNPNTWVDGLNESYTHTVSLLLAQFDGAGLRDCWCTAGKRISVCPGSFISDAGISRYICLPMQSQVDEYYKTKFCDFGLAQHVSKINKPADAGTPPYVAPEIWQKALPSKASDGTIGGVCGGVAMTWRGRA
jgi:serine/threonine protein kinase